MISLQLVRNFIKRNSWDKKYSCKANGSPFDDAFKKVSYTQIHHMNSVFFNEKKNTDVLLLRSTNITE